MSSCLRVICVLCLLPAIVAGTCSPDDATLLPARRQTVSGEQRELLARFVHVTDSHIVDQESPARLAGAGAVVSAAWREWESCSTQLYDGIIRTANRIHVSGRTVDFLVHTGDATDNVQHNELSWFMAVMNGGLVNPLSGVDDRPLEARPEPHLDPHATFLAQGLYRQGVHGDASTIPWYVLMGNHDVYAVGVFPIVTGWGGLRVAPLPLQPRPGILLPSYLNPTGSLTHGRVTPNRPGPPDLYTWPQPVLPVADRAFFDEQEFIDVLLASPMSPPGHGFEPGGPPWYSTSPVSGVRLIGLHTSDHVQRVTGLDYHEGAISQQQLEWLRAELAAATDRGEIIIVASHHPSRAMEGPHRSAVDHEGIRRILNDYSGVVVHLAGHRHQHRVADRGGYVEIETASTLDWPQEARLVEIWRDLESGEILVGYEVFSHVDEALPPLGDDPLEEMRRRALELAAARPLDSLARTTGDTLDSAGEPADRQGLVRLRSGR